MITSFISSLRWQDILDILILAIIMYRVILLVQGTRTIQILTGFSLVALMYYASNYLNLQGVSWIFTSIFNSLVVVIIVLFQADFRNALAQVGRTSLFRDKHKKPSTQLNQVIIDVCLHFSQTRTGALIVFEREVGLKNYTSSGTEVDALITPQLLVAIFNTHAPLHDGAVIIDRHGRLRYAGCILPLTSRLDLAQKIGTRHRAAIGLSEETDAVILVVSEETGKISLVTNGEILETSGKDGLYDAVEKYLPNN